MEAIIKQLAVGQRPFDDPFFTDGDTVCGFFKRLCVYDVDEEELCHQISKEFSCEVPGCRNTFATLMEFEIHYNTLHRYVCSICHKTLPSPHLLDLHIEESHDSFFKIQAERKPMFQCLVEDCSTKFQTPVERKDHCIKSHSFPSNFRWLMPASKSQETTKKSKPKRQQSTKNTKMETEASSNSAPIEIDVENGPKGLEEKDQASPTPKQKNRHRKKNPRKGTEMEVEGESSCATTELPKDESLSIPTRKTKSAATFKGFVPRNVTANRTFSQKAFFKGKDWHKVSPNSTTPPPFEGTLCLSDLKDCLPTDMDAS